VAGSGLLAFNPNSSSEGLNSLAVADSLIYLSLKKFNISEQQIKIQNIKVDTVLSRKYYLIDVPPDFSKTQLHLELAHALLPFGVSTPANVVFPQKDMVIHLVYQHTVIRSIELQTDSDLVMERNPASILVAVDGALPPTLLDQIIGFGEPLALALITNNVLDASELKKSLGDKYPYLLFWLKDEDGNNVLSHEIAGDLTRLQHLQEAIPEASVLSFANLDASASPDNNRLLSQTSLAYVDVSEAIMLDSEDGRISFRQELNKFVQKARRNEHPVAIVRGNSESLNWLQSELADFKKAGLHIVLPRKKQF
jgi:hypothetical protein